eukprot:4386986-Amphidinium_carterae.1
MDRRRLTVIWVLVRGIFAKRASLLKRVLVCKGDALHKRFVRGRSFHRFPTTMTLLAPWQYSWSLSKIDRKVTV